MPAADAPEWFGKAPPDLSLIARSRGPDYVYKFLTTFYADPANPTGVNNLRLPGTAMPHVLSELEGVKKAVFKNVEGTGEDGSPRTEQVLEKFETGRVGDFPEQYDPIRARYRELPRLRRASPTQMNGVRSACGSSVPDRVHVAWRTC